MNARALAEALVAVPSPTGSEQDVVALLQDRARDDGFTVRDDAAGNFVAEAGQGDRLLLWVGHVDTVPGDIPVRVEDEVLWGRGAVDAKGPLAAAYAAFRDRLDDPDLRIRMVGAVEEEGASRGVAEVPRDLGPEWILVGEPSGWDGVTIAYKGILRGRFSVTRPAGHGARQGPGALDDAVGFWTEARAQLRVADRFDAVQARLEGFTGQSEGLQETAHGRFQMRIPPGTAPEAVAAQLETVAGSRGVRLDVEEAVPAASASRRTPLVACLADAVRSQGGAPRVLRKTGTADFNHLHAWYPQVPIAAYGPGDSRLDHAPDERLDLRDLDRAVQVLDGTLDRLRAAPRPEGRRAVATSW